MSGTFGRFRLCGEISAAACLMRVAPTSHQRDDYQKLLEGEDSPLTEDRINRLDSVGFVWKKIKSRKRTREAP
jgi:hypothetical protein